MTKIDKFYEIKNLMQCPRCGKKMRFHAGGLVCKKEHRFDISSKGYVNLLQESKALKGYDAAFFAARNRFFGAGYYAHIKEAVIQAVLDCRKRCPSQCGEPFVTVDVGCGEGYYAVSLMKRAAEEGLFCDADEETSIQVLAFDLSSDAIRAAAKNPEPVKWMVADLTNIPIKDGVVSCILDVFTPANYGEFARILKPDGYVIKVVPGREHMGELRRAAADLLRNSEYSNAEVLDYFEQHFELVSRQSVSRTLPVTKEDLSDLTAMTPLFFDLDKNRLDLSDVKEITAAAEILIGRVK